MNVNVDAVSTCDFGNLKTPSGRSPADDRDNSSWLTSPTEDRLMKMGHSARIAGGLRFELRLTLKLRSLLRVGPG